MKYAFFRAKRWFCVSGWVVLISAGFSSRVSATLLAVEWNSNNSPVYSIDENTGAGTLIGLSGIPALNSLARNSSGALYSVGGGNPDNRSLVTINPNTGVATVVATLARANFRALTFSPTDVLYGIQFDTTSRLVTINVNTGAVTVIGSPGFAIQGLDFSADGTLYGFDVQNEGLIKINPANAVATDVTAADDSFFGGIQGLAFSPGGTLYGGGGSTLYSINTITATRTAIGGSGYSDIRGLAYIPEPNTSLLILIASLAFRRKRGRQWAVTHA